MKSKGLKTKLLLILLFFTMLLSTKLTVHSQVISIDSSQIGNILDSRIANCDSLKCFTYEQARQIITDLQQLPLKDSIICKLDSIIKIDSTIINSHEIVIQKQGKELIEKDVKIVKMKNNRKLFVIFGGIIGLCTQLLF
tara:strand:- start:59 stop:475 length:417 start_codon:yes stop_codon:yes gene_type:complete